MPGLWALSPVEGMQAAADHVGISLIDISLSILPSSLQKKKKIYFFKCFEPNHVFFLLISVHTHQSTNYYRMPPRCQAISQMLWTQQCFNDKQNQTESLSA